MFRNIPFTNTSFLPTQPLSLFVQEQCSLWSGAKDLLCIGDTEGSTALFLAQKGMSVEVLELRTEGVFDIYKHVSPHHLNMKIRHTTLEYWKPTPLFHGVVCTFVHVSKDEQSVLFKKCLEALHPEGLFVAELFSESQKSYQAHAPKEVEKLYNLNQTLQILKTLPCTLEKFSQEIISSTTQESLKTKASVLHIVARKTIA